MVTKVEVRDIRIEKVLPYIANLSGSNLEELLTSIDTLLKYSSPEAMAPGLINWMNKDLFVDKWIRDSGTGTLSYNQYGASKIAKGRFEISGTGRWYFDKYLAVSEVRGVTGRVFAGATQPDSIISVGVLCYDANKNFLGSNGGFICNNLILPLNDYEFQKSSAFGEMTSGARFLKPGTRMVRFYIEVLQNGGIVFFDESELTTFELDERYLQIFGTEIDWNRAEFFYTEKTISTAFTFKNALDGKTKTIKIKNTGSANIDVTFPTAQWQGGVPLTTIRPGRSSIFTFIKMGGIFTGSVIEEVE